MTIERVSLCTVKGCPEPKNPDFHIPICGHGLEGHHHHVTKRSQGGKDGPQVFICPECHNEIDNGLWGNAILDIPGVGKVYRVWTLKNETVFERVIGENAAEVELAGPNGHELGATQNDPPAPSSLTREQRINIAASIRADQQQRQWVAGDTANAWVLELGEEAWQYLDEFGYTHMSLSNIMHVCEAIPFPLRDGLLTYSHHVVVYRENREDIEMWLGTAQEEGWTVAQFREAVHGLPSRKKRWTLEEFKALMHQYTMQADSSMAGPIFDEFLGWVEEQDA